MKNILLSAFALFGIIVSNAQTLIYNNSVYNNITGQPFLEKKYTEVQGSPYFLDDWSNGFIILKDSTKIDKISLKFDTYANQLMYIVNGQQLIVQNPIKEFELDPSNGQQYKFRCGFNAVDHNTQGTFYQVLQDGPTSLLKFSKTTMEEKSNYGEATKISAFVGADMYYIAKANGDLVRIKKEKASLLDALSDKKDILTSFIEKQRLNCKSEGDMAAVVRAYNSPQK